MDKKKVIKAYYYWEQDFSRNDKIVVLVDSEPSEIIDVYTFDSPMVRKMAGEWKKIDNITMQSLETGIYYRFMNINSPRKEKGNELVVFENYNFIEIQDYLINY